MSEESRFRQALDELVHLFVDDGNLAAFSIVLILIVLGAVKLMNVPPLWGAIAVGLGVLAILTESLTRAAKGAKRR